MADTLACVRDMFKVEGLNLIYLDEENLSKSLKVEENSLHCRFLKFIISSRSLCGFSSKTKCNQNSTPQSSFE